MDTTKKPTEAFALYSANCMTCRHLSPETGTKSHVKCHFTKGNTQCPAAEVTFVVVGKALKYAKLVRKCRDERNAARESKLMLYVANQTDAFKSKFYDYLESGS